MLFFLQFEKQTPTHLEKPRPGVYRPNLTCSGRRVAPESTITMLLSEIYPGQTDSSRLLVLGVGCVCEGHIGDVCNGLWPDDFADMHKNSSWKNCMQDALNSGVKGESESCFLGRREYVRLTRTEARRSRPARRNVRFQISTLEKRMTYHRCLHDKEIRKRNSWIVETLRHVHVASASKCPYQTCTRNIVDRPPTRLSSTNFYFLSLSGYESVFRATVNHGARTIRETLPEGHNDDNFDDIISPSSSQKEHGVFTDQTRKPW